MYRIWFCISSAVTAFKTIRIRFANSYGGRRTAMTMPAVRLARREILLRQRFKVNAVVG
jgi:hypothetical protein